MAKILSQRAVDSAKPKAKRYPIPDGLVPNQYLLVHPSGEKSYAISPRLHGKTIKLTIGDATVLSLAQARAEGKRMLAEIALGGDPRAAKQEAAETAAETVAVVGRRFVERHVKPNTRRVYETTRILERNIISVWGRRPISSITRRDAVALLDAIADRGAPVMANRTLAVGKQLYAWAIERGIVEFSPFDHIKPATRETRRDRVLTDRELALVWDAADRIGFPAGSAIQLLILTGARRTEVYEMRWSELDRGLTTWTLPGTRTKNRLQHVVPLPPAARAILARVPRLVGSDYVFTVRGNNPISAGAGRAKQLIDATIAEPIAPWVVHDLRRTTASGMARLGTAVEIVEKVLNHAGGVFRGVAGTYLRHDYADERQAALEAWAQHVLSLDIGAPAVVALRA